MGNALTKFVKLILLHRVVNLGKESDVSHSARGVAWSFVVLALAAITSVLVQGCAASCKPMQVNGVNMTCSGGATGYMWTGTTCIYTHACNCTGADCQRLYPSQDSCDNAHLQCSPK